MAQFDPEKDRRNRAKHKLPLAFGEKVFADPHYVETLDRRFAYGEDRWKALGMVDGIVYALVFTERGGSIRIISVRKAVAEEVDRYFRSRAGDWDHG